jgi:cytosine deaminase
VIPSADRFWINNARVPVSLLHQPDPALVLRKSPEDLTQVNLLIDQGIITQIQPAQDRSDSRPQDRIPAVDWRGGQVWPCFVDVHTHLDKGHVWERSPHPEVNFLQALNTIKQDRQHWTVEDVYRRMEFGLKCSYAHGTAAIRTHLDVEDNQLPISLQAFQALKHQWHDRLILQASALIRLEAYLTPLGQEIANQMAEVGGILGGVAYPHPDLEAQLDQIFLLAQERGLDLDFHTDENNNPNSMTLRQVAAAVLRHRFTGKVICGHCCSLAVQSDEVAQTTLQWVKEAGIGIVSLPLCNLYLQDRTPGRTPTWRGVTRLQEINQQGIPVALASDNCRDPFLSYGDHDVLEVFTQSTRIAHLDSPYQGWPRAVTQTAAELMGLPQVGQIGLGLPADLVLFKGRTFSELLARPQQDRIVLRQGKAIDTTLPDYAELDDLMVKQED